MMVGNLVRLKCAKIGVPADSLGLLVEKHRSNAEFDIWVVKFACREHTRRLMRRDLEVVSS